jgi:hypothetical protein
MACVAPELLSIRASAVSQPDRAREALVSFRDVTRFMLARAIALREAQAPLFYWAKTPAASAFAASRSIRPRWRSAPRCRAPHRPPGIDQSSGTTADFRLGAFRSLIAATRRAASSAARAQLRSSSGSSNSRSGARQKERSIVLPFFS